MNKLSPITPSPDIASQRRRLAAMRLREIEGNPLDADDVAMFEREAWTHRQRDTSILAQAGPLAAR